MSQLRSWRCCAGDGGEVDGHNLGRGCSLIGTGRDVIYWYPTLLLALALVSRYHPILLFRLLLDLSI